jgi:hypothetical protein
MTISDVACVQALMTIMLILWVRNWFVHRFLDKVLEAVAEQGRKEIEEWDFLTYRRRSVELSSVSCLEMVLLFWKPCRSFFADKELIRPLLYGQEREEKPDG